MKEIKGLLEAHSLEKVLNRLVGSCYDEENKLDLLTSIFINSGDPEICALCEEIRNDLPESVSDKQDGKQTEIIRNKVESKRVSSSVREKRSDETNTFEDGDIFS